MKIYYGTGRPGDNLIANVSVHGLKNAFRVSKFPMLANVDKVNDSYTDTIEKLAKAPAGSAHDNFLKGVVVTFDLSFTNKAWVEAERYHWFEIISSQSTMHRISAIIGGDDPYCEYVTESTKAEVEKLAKVYNETKDPEDYLRLLYNTPSGVKITAGIVTNYQQLKTIYRQRKNHRLPEWRAFCEWIETLPYADLITGAEKPDVGGDYKWK